MLSNWQRVVQEKLYLAEILLRQAGEPAHRSDTDAVGLQNALLQGALALLLQARTGLLLLIAELNQNRTTEIRDLRELGNLLGNDNPDVLQLERLSRDRTGWWQHLAQLEVWLKRPTSARKPATDSGLIAVSADGPDLSASGLLELVAAFKAQVSELCGRHDEW